MQKDDFVIRIRGVSVAYGERNVLKDVNIEVKPGEFWFLLGPNGAGKTTLLKALLGILRPQEGDIQLHPEFFSRNSLGFVPQRCDLNPTLPTTVKEFVMLGLAGLRLDRAGRSGRLSWALEKMQLKNMGERNYWSLSGGQRQRALVARALIRRPKILIADEPTKDLDLPGANALMEDLTELNRKENLTVLFVTHDLTLAARYATHVALFLDGLIQVGTKHAILNPEGLERTYGIPLSVFEESEGVVCIRICTKEGGL